jgi:hypothetical protein
MHERLVLWGKDKFYPGWPEPTPSALLVRLMDEGRDERRKRYAGRVKTIEMLKRKGVGLRTVQSKESQGVRMELVVLDGETTACPPDGGVQDLVKRWSRSVDVSTACREVGQQLVHLQDFSQDLWDIVRVTYRDAMNPGELPRKGWHAASLLKISERTYWTRRKQALFWLGQRVLPQLFEGLTVDLQKV